VESRIGSALSRGRTGPGEHGTGGDPGVWADGDRAEAEVKAGGAEVVVAGAEVGALGDADAIAQGDGGEVVEPGVLRQPAGLAHLQAPGEFHAQAGLAGATGADAGPEQAQQPHTPGRTGQPACRQQGGTEAEPTGEQQPGGTGMPVGRGAVAIELLDHRLAAGRLGGVRRLTEPRSQTA
jgi:hypothetical protein